MVIARDFGEIKIDVKYDFNVRRKKSTGKALFKNLNQYFELLSRDEYISED